MIVRLVFLFGAVALAAGVAGGGRPAAACGMDRMPVEVGPARADALLVLAREKMDAGQWDQAASLVRRVASSGLVKAAQRAEALAIVGWSAWRGGGRPGALRSLRRARSLDGTAMESVLARARAPEQVTALRAALEG